MVKNPLCSAADISSIPGSGGAHVQQLLKPARHKIRRQNRKPAHCNQRAAPAVCKQGKAAWSQQRPSRLQKKKKRDHMLDQTMNFNKFKSAEIIQTMFFYHVELKLVTKSYLEILNIWNLSSTPLNNLQLIITEAQGPRWLLPPWRLSGEESTCSAGHSGWIPGSGRPLEDKKATHSSFLPGESHGQRSLVGYSPRGAKSGAGLGPRTYTHVRECLGVLQGTGFQLL